MIVNSFNDDERIPFYVKQIACIVFIRRFVLYKDRKQIKKIHYFALANVPMLKIVC